MDPAKFAEFENVSHLARQLLLDLQQQPRDRQVSLADCAFRNVFASISRGIRWRMEVINAAQFGPLLEQLTSVLGKAYWDHPELKAALKRYADEFSSIWQLSFEDSKAEKASTNVPTKAEDLNGPQDSNESQIAGLEKLLVAGKEAMLMQKRGRRVVDLVNKLISFLKRPHISSPSTKWMEIAAEVVHLVVTLICEEKSNPPSHEVCKQLLELLHAVANTSSVFGTVTKEYVALFDRMRFFVYSDGCLIIQVPREAARLSLIVGETEAADPAVACLLSGLQKTIASRVGS
ncbi:hypothetical protein PINS_up008796 [Pythium insidiosum]|nr:hypothetical protein PINS_up008796 [Pythium insidiosum]